MFKSGFINILGNPNVGKSTLMNELVGERLSIITSKAQTTRHRILGILNGEDFQMVFSDTPGIVKPVYKLHENMMHLVRSAFSDADIVLYVTDVVETRDKHEHFINKLKKIHVPVIVAINKTDLSNPTALELLENEWKQLIPKATVLLISALYKQNINVLFEKLIELLPEGPVYYPDDSLTDRPERFFVSEIVREKIFLNYQKEIPYSCEVVIDSYKEADDMVRINAIIHVLRDTQKGIIIGHKGESLKKTGTQARLDIEKFLGKRVYLGLQVKVAPDWRNNDKSLKRFGY
ncbi:MAG: GTPase Era [Alphaproteobacteria bacterium]|nr:MAG: GTPase Era [Alphaproteobacteria bacterium]